MGHNIMKISGIQAVYRMFKTRLKSNKIGSKSSEISGEIRKRQYKECKNPGSPNVVLSYKFTPRITSKKVRSVKENK